ncbi:MAG: hypothetical protein OES47_05370 [Acidobacteriota bacterium]|nr:hypothetical protein [Acidobacteriota bacterium]
MATEPGKHTQPPGAEKAPTMIIPEGTDIQVDVHGQLSIRTPGNLVIQHSGHYSTLESMNGSIRIEPHADVEAVNVRCAGTCFVEGTLTAWKVMAHSIHLEDSARANIVLQETERLEVGQNARLVGNFRSEKELFLLFSRFANELRALPRFTDRRQVELGEGETAGDDGGEGGDGAERENVSAFLLAGVDDGDDRGPTHDVGPATDGSKEADPSAATTSHRGEGGLPDPLFFSQVILEREFTRPSYGPTSQRAIEEIVKLLRDHDLETLRLTYRTLFGRIVEPGKDIQRVYGLIDGHFTDGSGG